MKAKTKVMVVFGTRPEAIKMALVIKQLKSSRFDPLVCVTAQHREILDQVLRIFDIKTDYDLNIMMKNQDLFDVTTNSLIQLKEILLSERPDLVLVQGDTTTAFAAALAAFYLEIPVGHVEAGLRTYNKYSPFPEEKNRHMVGVLADYHFTPTQWAKNNLLREQVPEKNIWITGNTVIDSLMAVVNKQKSASVEESWDRYFKKRWNIIISDSWKPGRNASKMILVTCHRRESFNKGLKNICMALKEIAEKNPQVSIVYPVHPNPNVREPVHKILGSNQRDNIYVIDPLPYEPFVYLMNRCCLTLTDSGGIQEEAPSLGKPVLVMRNVTERPEGVEAGTSKLVGTDRDTIVMETGRLLSDRAYYEKMARTANPYGDGKASERIVAIIKKLFGQVS